MAPRHEAHERSKKGVEKYSKYTKYVKYLQKMDLFGPVGISMLKISLINQDPVDKS